jgi:hypothetical protein
MKKFPLVLVLGIASAALMAQGGSPTFPDAVRGDPKHYSVEFENELVRVVRAKYGPGEKSVMHSHPASCAIFLVDQNFKFTIPDGTTEDDSARAGEVRCGDADVHLPENAGPGTVELVVLEFKDRQTFKK